MGSFSRWAFSWIGPFFGLAFELWQELRRARAAARVRSAEDCCRLGASGAARGFGAAQKGGRAEPSRGVAPAAIQRDRVVAAPREIADRAFPGLRKGSRTNRAVAVSRRTRRRRAKRAPRREHAPRRRPRGGRGGDRRRDGGGDVRRPSGDRAFALLRTSKRRREHANAAKISGNGLRLFEFRVASGTGPCAWTWTTRRRR